MRIPVAVILCAVSALAATPAGQPQQVDLILYNAIVVTMDGASRVLPRGAVAIQGNNIVAVDAAENVAASYTARETLDADGQIVMPGLINTHTHAPMVLYRGLADDLALMDWLQKYIFPAEAKTVTREFVRTSAAMATGCPWKRTSRPVWACHATRCAKRSGRSPRSRSCRPDRATVRT